MPPALVLLVTQGPLKGKRFTFLERTECVLGRGGDCFPRFPDRPEFRTISRRHCLLKVDPPRASLRDLGSLNGTWLNNLRLGPKSGEAPGDRASGPEAELKDGDEVRIGNTVFQVRLAAAGIEAEDKSLDCAGCGASLVRKPGAWRLDGFLCAQCQKSPRRVVQALLDRADQGAAGLAAFKGLSIERELGQGAAGAVFLIRRPQEDRPLAFKLLLPEVAVRETARQAFLREVANAQVLSHPHVVRLFDSGNFLGVFFYTMEFCDAGSLNDLIYKHSGKVPLEVAGPLILQILDGLEYIHQAQIPHVRLADGRTGQGQGLVHRDLKPANVFLNHDPDGLSAKIADVGVGKAFDTAGLSGLTRTGTIAGSPVTMPRQQVINFKYARPDVDVWAAAATLYIMLTGRWPRDFKSDQDPCLTVLKEKPVPIRRRDPSLPGPLAELIDAALVDDPEITFKSAAQLKKALEVVL
ncbi:MAG: FHA domain-containing serine/threonine-protein kinase [Thermodesulfobacteriota bacterium]